MSIKIISYNSNPDPKYVATCPCGCQFTFNFSDVKHEYGRMCGPDDPLIAYIECPAGCGRKLYKTDWDIIDPIAQKEY